MEHIKSICAMRELLKALTEFESQLESRHGISLNGAMVLCCIGDDTVSASFISSNTGLSPSNTSKVIRAVETAGLLTRAMGDSDRRQMHFTLTDKGRLTLQSLKAGDIDLPEILKSIVG